MKLVRVRLKNFQCFGPEVTEITFERLTFLIGPNASGKTALLQALSRLFGSDPGQRRLRSSDFHIPHDETEVPSTRELWLEADFEFPELGEDDGPRPAVAVHFSHMQIDGPDGAPQVRFRLTGSLDSSGEPDETFCYVLATDEEGEPAKTATVRNHDRRSIQVHYLPARRNPTDHVTYSASSMIGRLLRAANWDAQRIQVPELTEAIGSVLGENDAVKGLTEHLASKWSALHSGTYFSDPAISFVSTDIDGLLAHLTLAFTPSHDGTPIDFTRLSDGQQSLLYVSLVLAVQSINRQVLAGELEGFDLERLSPPVFSLLAVEEPENSLSPHYLGRVLTSLGAFADGADSQALVATHAPALLHRVKPEQIRYLRLNSARESTIKEITLPEKTNDAYKYVREAVRAFPELYFARLVVLGEGPSEEIVLDRCLKAAGLGPDATAISVVPLGGRHVNHFWRLLSTLGISHMTLLDLDVARNQGGWGRIRYAAVQLMEHRPEVGITEDWIEKLPNWNGTDQILESERGEKSITYFEKQDIFFSTPLDLDLAMMLAFPDAYELEASELVAPTESRIESVLGDSHGDEAQYSEEFRSHFDAYYRRFKLSGKPSSHVAALSELTDEQIAAGAPPEIQRLAAAITTRLKGMPE